MRRQRNAARAPLGAKERPCGECRRAWRSKKAGAKNRPSAAPSPQLEDVRAARIALDELEAKRTKQRFAFGVAVMNGGKERLARSLALGAGMLQQLVPQALASVLRSHIDIVDLFSAFLALSWRLAVRYFSALENDDACALVVAHDFKRRVLGCDFK